jgi:Putative DNA-binding domain
MQPSQAKNFFDQIFASSKPAQFLRSLISSSQPTFETEWLDFKGAEKISDSDLKRTWSEALSGFANTQGGVLIFGIDARLNAETKIDAACGESLVPDVAACVSRLQQLHGQATEPPVLGVEIRPVPADEKSPAGFVVCYIPESPYRPHRAEHAGRNYFIRALDDFVIPSVSLLRALFHPHARALITPIVQGEVYKKSDFEVHEITVWVANRGTASAYDLYVIVDYQPSSALPQRFKDWETGVLHPFHATYLKPIHPGQRFSCVGLIYTAEKSNHYTFAIRTFAKDVEAMVWRAELSLKDLERKVERVAELQESP